MCGSIIVTMRRPRALSFSCIATGSAQHARVSSKASGTSGRPWHHRTWEHVAVPSKVPLAISVFNVKPLYARTHAYTQCKHS
jgi:hypothetical protein